MILKAPRRLGKYVRKIWQLPTYLLLIGIAFVFIYPFIFVLLNSLKSSADIYDTTVKWLPQNPTFENYQIAFTLMNYFKYFKNTALLTATTVTLQLISCSMIGYGFARYNFPCKKILFSFVVISVIVPVQTLIIPLYITFLNFDWLNTFAPMIIPTFFGFGLKGALFIFIFRQFYQQLPADLENAARIDGCNFFGVYLRIVLPVARSAFLVVAVLAVVWHWNDFYEPSIYASSQDLMMLPNALYILINFSKEPPPPELLGGGISEVIVNSAVVMAGVMLVILPVVLIYAVVQRQFVQGIERTGIVE